jgi:cytidylate kinase
MTVITISRQLGARGEEIGVRVAKLLDLRLIDAETISRAAAIAGVPQVALDELQNEGDQGLANRVLKALSAMPSLRGTTYAPPPGGESRSTLTIPFAGLFSPTVPPISASLEDYVRMVDLVIRGLAEEGQVLIMGRGGQVVLKDYPGALHVQIVAPFAKRVQVAIERHGLDKRAAQNRVRASERARFDYLRRYHDVDRLDPTLYHLVINTGWLSIDTAVALIAAAQKDVAQAPRDDQPHE